MKCACGHRWIRHGVAGCMAAGARYDSMFCRCAKTKSEVRQAKGDTSGSDRGAEASGQDTQASGDANAGTDLVTVITGFHTLNAIAAGLDTKPREGPGLEVVEQEEPIRAWRGLRIVVDGATVRLASLNTSGTFGVTEAEAVCRAQWRSMAFATYGSPHPAPAENCDCGFYGVKDRANALGNVIAEVDLYGTVIEHDLGYRAQFQRVLSVRIKRPAYCGGAFLCPGEPVLLAFGDRDEVEGRCMPCAAMHPRSAHLREVAARLGVEVRWDD